MNKLISVQQADNFLREYIFTFTPIKTDLLKCLGKKLYEDIIADRQYPPYNRVAMDGIAVLGATLKKQKYFPIVGIQTPGSPPKELKHSEQCLEVMTGAILPNNTDTVIPYEQITIQDNIALFKGDSQAILNKNIHFCGSDYKKDKIIVKKGTLLNSTHIAIAASVGKTELIVNADPKIALVATGDELVSHEQKTIKDWQIRSSNFMAIQADLQTSNFTQISYYHLHDNYQQLKKELSLISQKNSIIILSGGVSMGKFDFIPKVLQEIGIKEIFHKVKQKPGKPLWFGIQEKKAVFGLPGNPVSSLICYHRYVLPYIYNCLGLKTHYQKLVFNEKIKIKQDFCFFVPVRQEFDQKNFTQICHTNGSGDFSGLANSNGFIELHSDKKDKNNLVNFYPWLTSSIS